MQDSGNILKEQGLVVSVNEDHVLVETQRSTGCSGCSSESGCGTSALSKLFVGTSKGPLKVKKTVDCQVGDRVELWLDESRLLKHSFMAYGLPLIGLFVMAISLSKIAESLLGQSSAIVELFAVVGGMLGLFLGWWITRRIYKPILPEIGAVLKS